MSNGNAGAAIGLPNTNKLSQIGGFTPHTSPQGPSAAVPVIGVGSRTYFTPRTPPYEDPTVPGGFTMPGDVQAGKHVRLVTTGPTPLLVPADGRVDVSATGVATAAAGVGLYDIYITPNTTIPAFTGLWAYQR